MMLELKWACKAEFKLNDLLLRIYAFGHEIVIQNIHIHEIYCIDGRFSRFALNLNQREGLIAVINCVNHFVKETTYRKFADIVKPRKFDNQTDFFWKKTLHLRSYFQSWLNTIQGTSPFHWLMIKWTRPRWNQRFSWKYWSYTLNMCPTYCDGYFLNDVGASALRLDYINLNLSFVFVKSSRIEFSMLKTRMRSFQKTRCQELMKKWTLVFEFNSDSNANSEDLLRDYIEMTNPI